MSYRSVEGAGKPWEVRDQEHFVLRLTPGANVNHPPFLARAELVGYQLQSLDGLGSTARVIPGGVYDREVVMAGRETNFFQEPSWLAGAHYKPEPAFDVETRFKTPADTNMVTSGCMPRGTRLYVKGARLWADDERARTWLREHAVRFQVSNLIVTTFPAVAALHPPNAGDDQVASVATVALDDMAPEHERRAECRTCRRSFVVRSGAAAHHDECGRVARLVWEQRDSARALLYLGCSSCRYAVRLERHAGGNEAVWCSTCDAFVFGGPPGEPPPASQPPVARPIPDTRPAVDADSVATSSLAEWHRPDGYDFSAAREAARRVGADRPLEHSEGVSRGIPDTRSAP